MWVRLRLAGVARMPPRAAMRMQAVYTYRVISCVLGWRAQPVEKGRAGPALAASLQEVLPALVLIIPLLL